MHDGPIPEAPVIVLRTRNDYEVATRRARELSEAEEGSSAYLELVALRAAIAQWEGDRSAPSPRADR